MTTPSTNPFDYAVWDTAPDVEDNNPREDVNVPPGRPTEWNGKPIPDNALWSDDGVTPLTTPTGRIRRSRGPRATTGKVTAGKATAVDLAQVESDMVDFCAKVAMATQWQLPTVSLVIIQRGEATSRAMVQIARNRPRMLAAMQRAAQVGPVVELATTGVMIVAAVALDTGRAQITDPIAVVTGVSELHKRVNPNAAAQEEPIVPPFTMPEQPMSATPPFTVKEAPGDIADPDHARYAFAAGTGAGSVPYNGAVPAGAVTPLRGGPFGGNFPA